MFHSDTSAQANRRLHHEQIQTQNGQQHQLPVCEAFIMTGETILKTYTNTKSEKKKTVSKSRTSIRAADTTTPCITANSQKASNITNELSSQHQKNKTTSNNNNNNSNEDNKNRANVHAKHAQQLRETEAIEQKVKSASLSQLNESTPSNGLLAVTSDLLRRSSRVATGGDKHRNNVALSNAEAVAEGPKARCFVPLHERSQQRQQQQSSEQQQQSDENRLLNDEGRSPNDRLISDFIAIERENNPKLKDCEYLVSKQETDLAQSNKQTQLMDQETTNSSAARTATFNAITRRQMKEELNKLIGNSRPRISEEGDFLIEFKSGFLNRKRIFEPREKPTSKGQRGWRRIFVIVRDLRFIVRYGQLENEQNNVGKNKVDYDSDPVAKKMDEQAVKARKQLAAKDVKNTIRLHHSFAKRSTSYTKREYVFHLYLADQSQLLLQANSEDDMNSWIDAINFASACLSSPPLPSAVSNSKRYHQSRTRPILPGSYTKLSYWEQLTDHEERLERLKTELEEHLNEALVKRHADKRAKSEFIDKIAYLKQKIEHYTVYLDLMQKKSNSPEAIVLSKHPQIASLTPSREMVRVLPLNGKAHLDEDKKDAQRGM